MLLVNLYTASRFLSVLSTECEQKLPRGHRELHSVVLSLLRSFFQGFSCMAVPIKLASWKLKKVIEALHYIVCLT